MAKSIFKVGDMVTIKDLTKGTGSEYRFGINSDMIEMSGQSFEIASIEEADPRTGDGCIPDDGYRYKLENALWSWASSMLQKASEASIIHSVIKTKDSSIDAFIKKNGCPVLDFTL